MQEMVHAIIHVIAIVCCDMGQNDTIGKIELKIIFRLAVGISNSRNDIQLFLQLFDELRVNGDYH